MKLTDLERLHADGLITAEQRDRIRAHYDLREDAGKFLTILSVFGGVMVVAGIVLLISANWDAIPRLAKIAVGLVLMLGAYASGWWLRDHRQSHVKTGEALYLIGSGMFLANIALVGQVYHLSSRPPNAILLWWAGIAALPWILRSEVQHVLALAAFWLWFAMELNDASSWFECNDSRQLIFFSLLGLAYYGFGNWLRHGRTFSEFAPATEKLGLLGFQVFLWTNTIDIHYRRGDGNASLLVGLYVGLALIGLGLLAAALRRDGRLTPQWRWTWGVTLAGCVGFMAAVLWWPGWNQDMGWLWYHRHWSYSQGLASLIVFVTALIQIQVALQQRSRFAVNLGVAIIAADLIATYCVLLGSMTDTGLMFLVSGVLLLGLGVYLEKQRRKLLRQLNPQPTGV